LIAQEALDFGGEFVAGGQIDLFALRGSV